MIWWILRWLFGVGRGNARRSRPSGFRPGRPFAVRVVSVQDGDSLVIRPVQGRNSAEFRVRLYAIDAPEHDQEYGQEAREYLRRLVWNRTDLMVGPVDTDQYGRLVGVLYYRGVDRRRSVNRLMVEQGLARWYRRYGGDGLGLEQAEENARRRRRGVWASGGQVAPWEHRRAQREASARGGRLRWLLAGATVGTALGLLLLWTMLY